LAGPSENHDPELPLGKEPLIFISHHHGDATLAHHFVDLLESTTKGKLKSFCASDPRDTFGIGVGDEWYPTLIEKLTAATDVVVLLTPRSVDRPWIHYEVGFAKGREQSAVFGITFGVTLAATNSGPFAQFQNCADDEGSLTELLIRLIRRNLFLEVTADAIRSQVQEFRRRLPELGVQKPEGDSHEAVARMFEEIKLIARDLKKNQGANLLGPRFFEEFPLLKDAQTGVYDATGWLVFIGVLKDDLPWLYEIGLELYRALGAGNRQEIALAKDSVLRAVQATAQNSWLRARIAQTNRELAFRLFNLPYLVEMYLSQIEP
jgi:hypothetical protein